MRIHRWAVLIHDFHSGRFVVHSWHIFRAAARVERATLINSDSHTMVLRRADAERTVFCG